MGALRSLRSLLLFALVLVPSVVFAQPVSHPQITAPISDARVVRLPGSTHPLTKAAKDLGRASSATSMQRMMLVMKPTVEQEQALRKLIDAQHNPNSSQYHSWLTPEQFSERFAPVPEDVKKVSDWLGSHGFAVEKPARGGRWIEFSGTAAQVESAFHTEMHRYQYQGQSHFANATDVAIPQAMATAVAGVLSLHDFRKPAAHVNVAAVTQDASSRKLRGISPAKANADKTKLDPNVTVSDGSGYAHFLAPGDFARIYNALPLLNAGTDGSGVSIAIVGRTDIQLSDVQSFRNLFGLPSNDPVFITNGPDPGVTGDEIESDLDVEWAGAVAPNATIKFVTTASTSTTDGVDLSAAYIVDNAIAPIMSTSYGLCEAYLGPAGNVFENALYQQAAAEGISAFVSSGDNGSAGCDFPQSGSPAYNGLMVSGLASSPYLTAVGGTQFNEGGQNGTYWSANNNDDFSSALGYVPEAVWNESCDPIRHPAQCNYFSLEAGSGGASNCSDVTWTTDQYGNITATCNAGYAKPNWQAGTGVPDDKVRDLPDVSLAAAGGHDGYIICSEYAWPFYDLTCQVDTTNGQHTILNAGIVGGTSAAAPSMAGALALVEHKNGQWLGLANYNFYKLAAADTLAECNSSKLTDPTVASKCVFHDVTKGTNAVPCAGGTPDCSVSDPSLTGVLTGHAATAGFDLATGLGSVDITNLADAWATATSLGTTTTMTAAGTTVVHGQPLTLNVTVAPSSGTGTPTGDFDLVTSNAGTVFGGTLANGTFNAGVNDLPGGSYTFTARYGGDGMFASSQSAPVSMTVTPEDSTLNFQAYYANFVQYLIPLSGNVNYGTAIVIDAHAVGKSGIGKATGTVTILLDGKNIASFPLDGNGDTSLMQIDTLVPNGILPGDHTLSASYSGDGTFNPSTSATTYPFTIIKTTPNVFTSASALTVTAGNPITFDVLVGSPGAKLAAGTVRLWNADTGTAITDPIPLSGSADGAMAHFTTSNLPVGSFTVKASYSGSPVYTNVAYDWHNSNGPWITVNPVTGAMDTVTLTATPASVTLGGSVNYVIKVKPAKAGSPTPTGTVLLLGQNGGVYGSGNPVPLVNGAATFVLPWYWGGSYSMYADYSGDSNYTPQQSAGIVTTVNPGKPTVSLSAGAPAVLPGMQTSLTVTVVGQPSNPNLSFPFGAVQFYDSVNGAPAQPLGSPQYLSVATGYNPIVSYPAALGMGTHVVSAQYLGTSDWAAAASNSVTVIVTNPDFALSVNNTTLNIPAGSTGTAQFTVSDLLGFSTGVSFACGSGVPAGSACSVTPSTLPAGGTQTAVLTLTTGAPSPQPSAALHWNFGFALGGGTGLAGLLLLALPGSRRRMRYVSLLMLIGCFGIVLGCGSSSTPEPKATMLQVASSNTKVASGDAVTFTATINGLASAQSGAVTFYDGNTSIGKADVSGAAATLQVNNLSVGAHAISAKYAGDSNNQPSASNTISQVVTGSTQLQVTATAGSVVHTATLTVNVQ